MSGSLDREALIALLDDLAGRLERRNVRAQVYIVGGAAMSLAVRPPPNHARRGCANRCGPRCAHRSGAGNRSRERTPGDLAERAGDEHDAEGAGPTGTHGIRLALPDDHRRIGGAHPGDEAGIREGNRQGRYRDTRQTLEHPSRRRSHAGARGALSGIRTAVEGGADSSRSADDARDDANDRSPRERVEAGSE